MKTSWQCRDYQKGDEQKILNLYQQVNKRQMTLPHWVWKFTQVPFGPAVIKLMFDGDNLIGHYAIIPMNVQIGKTVVTAALSVNTMTHPDYEKQGIFSYLAEEAYKKCGQRGFKFVYGFPNKNSYYGFTHKLGWRDLGGMTVLEKDLRAAPQRERQLVDTIHSVEQFDERIDLLWKTVRDGYNVTVPRTSEYLNWRFVKHPVEKYAMFVVEDDNRGVSGYLVLKRYVTGQEVKGHIVDMLCIDDSNLAGDLIRYAESYFIENGITNLSCWASERSFYGKALAEEGFKRQEFGVYFGVKTLDKKDETLRNIEQKDNWHLTMANLDVF